MLIKISIELNGKNHGLAIEIDEDAIKEEHKGDPELKTISDSILEAINKVAKHVVSQITIHKEDGEVDLEL